VDTIPSVRGKRGRPAGGRSDSSAIARVANGAIGALVGVYAFLDDLLHGPILVAVTVWVPWYLVFGVAACARRASRSTVRNADPEQVGQLSLRQELAGGDAG
jgi:hypothetical protein